MLKFTAGYADTLNNFVIGQLDRYPVKTEDPNYPVLCIVKNILTRGTKIRLSEYLKGQFPVSENKPATVMNLPLISSAVPNWHKTILGSDNAHINPARDFYYNIIPEYLGSAKGLQQLILPEALITDLLAGSEFIDQRVDFYLPQVRLVIEIDGSQHMDAAVKANDSQRDSELKKTGIETVRISAASVQNRDASLDQGILKIKERINLFWAGIHKKNISDLSSSERSLVTPLSAYSKMESLQYERPENQIVLTKTAVIRLQIFLLSMMQRGLFDLSSKELTICFYSNDLKNSTVFENALKLALNDVRIWISQVQSLLKIEHSFPEVQITRCESVEDFPKTGKSINIDFSLLQRWDDMIDAASSYFQIRSDYYESDVDYYQLNCSSPLTYQLNIDEDSPDNDISNLEFFIGNLYDGDQITSFREGQLPIIANVLAHRDTIGILPTGVGKSLCYQLAALLQPCISIIITPLKSLMLDQRRSVYQKLCMNHVDYINSSQTAQERNRLQKDLANGKYHFVWVSPERFQTQSFRSCLSIINTSMNLAYAVIDEVHCMSEWGHDFRTSYLNLVKTIRNCFFNPCILGLTATASSFVYKDLMSEFGITSDNVKTPSSFDRKELHFFVKSTDNSKSQEDLLLDITDKLSANGFFKADANDKKYHKAGLIFTQTKNISAFRKGCKPLAALLDAKYAIRCCSFSSLGRFENAGASNEDSTNIENQQLFLSNDIPLIVATKAFGMGIDKPNIRYVIHYGIPGSLDSLYQEAGRAGRDKMSANCFVLYSKDNLSKKNRDILFGLNSSIDQIRSIKDMVSKKSDLSTILYFFTENNHGLTFDLNVMKLVFDEYICPEKTAVSARAHQDQILSWEAADKKADSEADHARIENFLTPFSVLQKAVYRLSLLGLIKDWTVETWGEKTGVLSICPIHPELHNMRGSLAAYIRKYEPDFDLEEYIESLKSKNIINEGNSNPDQIMIALLKWTEENILYNRRMGIKNIIELCENYTDSESFRTSLEGYFRISEVQPILNYIADNSSQCGYWFEPFYKTDENHALVLSSHDNLVILKTSLSRMLENYRYHTGLNLISGLNMFLLGDFESPDGRPRLLSAFERIKTYDENRRNSILEDMLNLIEKHRANLQSSALNSMSEILCSNYPSYENWSKIYAKLLDDSSLSNILNYEVNRLSTIGRK